MATIQQFDYAVNLLQAMLWQYNKADNLQSLADDKQAWYDINQSAFWQEWFDGVFNLWNLTPLDQPGAFTNFGCTVWSIILNIPLSVGPAPDPEDAQIFSFDGDLPSDPNFNFDQGAFSNGSNSILLSLADKILLLRLRYFQLVTRGAIPEINSFMKKVFSAYGYPGEVFVLDNYDMTMTYVFTTFISDNLKFILANYDILPRPAAVELKVVQVPESIFAFDNPQNFDNGNFIGYI